MTKYERISVLARETAKEICANREEWIRYLDVASRLYKYPFEDQILIYAQRPDATACASLEMWNEKMFCWVNRGAKGIALIDGESERPRLRYVFDVSDVHKAKRIGKEPFIWKMKEEHQEVILAELEKVYGSTDANYPFESRIYEIAKRVADDFYEEILDDLIDVAANSYLEDLDGDCVAVRLREMLEQSVCYTIMKRCGLDMMDFAGDFSFEYIHEFNTLRTLSVLGSATSELCEPMLVQIGRSIAEELGTWLSEQKDTRVYTLNLCEMEKSMHFNPFPYIRSKSDVTKLVTNLIQNTNSQNIKNSVADPFWEKAERMFLESLFLYVWMECPKGVYNPKKGKAELLQKNWKSILYLLDEAQFVDNDTPPKLDERMNELARKKPDHPAVKAYQRYRGGPDETIRSVIMTVNARMQPFDNEELLEIFSSHDIPLDEFGTGIDGDGKTKSNLFIIIPDDDDTFNFVPGMVYTLLFQELYRQARFFGGKLPMDVGFWLDEMANIKMPNNFDKILATCRSRGVYCVPILQSLAQLKTLFADGAWEGIVGNCDTFIYLGGNEASTYEYVSKLLGKWTIDKRTSGESKGSSGSYSENYDVLGRELMLEYELRLLPDDECIIFVRGENPIRDKKWFPWEHEEYLEARKCGVFNPSVQKEKQEKQMEECQFVNEESVEYLKKQKEKNENIRLYGMDAFSFMMMDLDGLEKKIHSTPNDKKGQGEEITLTASMIQAAIKSEQRREEEERKTWFVENFDRLTLLDIYSSDLIGEVRRNVVRDLLKADADEEVIKSIIRPEFDEGQVLQKKAMWLEMRGK